MIDVNYDALIIGLGPAGVSAAQYLQLAGYNVIMVGKKDGGLFKAEKINNFYGQSETSGSALFEKGVRNAKKLGATALYGEVFGISVENDEFSVTTSKGNYNVKTILIATGVSRNKPNVKNLQAYDGNGVSWCAVCDGFLYRKRKVGVLGNGDYAIEEAEYLKGLGCDVTLFTNGLPLPKTKLKINAQKITELYGEDGLEGVILEDGDKVLIDALFVALGSASAVDFARKIGLEFENGYLKVDAQMQTSCRGIYAAGDCIGGLLQVSKAVYDGAIAGIAMSKYLKEKTK